MASPTPNVLIVQSDQSLALVWARHLQRFGMHVNVVDGTAKAFEILSNSPVDVIVADVLMSDGGAVALADYANFRRPEAKVIFVTNASFFSDGSLFQYCSNAAACVSSTTPVEDLAAMVEYHAPSVKPAAPARQN
ncbi:response regulator [Pseudaestuariivita sp.]|uniref:response regulator n=1 Tax=Pseudaestuariivita sp. TaxID=2211669 RepID=UPI0040591724